MAILIPEVPGDCPRSERLLYERMGRELPNDWIVLHSMEITNHPKKMWSETDIVVVSTKGVFVIEVKGGKISCVNGEWIISSLDGSKSYTRKESPWGQASSAASAIREKLYADDRFRGCLIGYGVAMPFVSFTENGEEIVQDVLWDKRHSGENLGFFIGRIANYWSDRQEATKERAPKTIHKPDLAEIRKLLRPDVTPRYSLGSYLTGLEAELIELTEAQCKAMRGMAGNTKSIVSGLAGTGKTILAVEKAIACARSGKSVLLLCYNKLLAKHLKLNIPDNLLEHIRVSSLHSFYREAISDANLLDLFLAKDDESQDFYGKTMPEVFVEAALTIDLPEFDVLIVDEAQDILTPAHLDAMDLVLAGGLTLGDWHLFWDPQQDIYGSLSDQAQERLSEIGFAKYELTVNCRNTKPVAIQTSVISGKECALEDAIDGPECLLIRYKLAEGCARLVNTEIAKLLEQDLNPEDIIILSTRTKKHSTLNDLASISGYPIVDLTKNEPVTDHIAFCTMHSFKGLERTCAIIVDIDDLEDMEKALLHYTGLSRARSLLVIFLPIELEDQYKRHLRDFGARLVS